ncbi:efflux RND transporter periplasmic adaptor subunit [Cohaesibacter celericrescens]|uniref:efflux RND transporter periplasmic adaptor subunit n=1 Tax=Cohaesibacter celericrescens TaxID=2067669 RepID=UPI0035626983
MSILKKFLFIPPIALALAVLLFSGNNAKPPQAAADKKEKATPVKVISVKAVTAVPSIRGYGKVQPARRWDAVAQVAGSVVWTADKLRNGLLIQQGSELLRIDAQEYELGLAQIDAQKEALAAKDETTRASLRIEERSLELLEDDMARKQQLLKQGSSAKAAVDAAERAMLTAQAKVQTLQSGLKLNQAERNILSRQRDIAALNVQRTLIKAPFDIRLGAVDIAQGQYVNKGQTLFSGDGIDVAEVIAQFPIGALSPLFGKTGDTGAALETLAEDARGVSERHELLKAKVRLHVPKGVLEWDAKLDRVSQAMDPKTRTRGIVLKVDDPYGQATPGQRPPLVRDTAVEVILEGQPQKNKIALPALSVRKGMVMVVDKDKRLRFKSVKVAYTQGDIVVLKSGIEPDEKVIVSDMPAPVDGMLVAPRPDKNLLADTMAAATGKKASEGKK